MSTETMQYHFKISVRLYEDHHIRTHMLHCLNGFSLFSHIPALWQYYEGKVFTLVHKICIHNSFNNTQ